MLSQKAFKEGIAIVLSIHKQFEPRENKQVIYRAWYSMFKDLNDKQFLDAVAKFMLEGRKLYPGDNFISEIRQIALPKFIETEGDCVELAFAAVRKFGYMRGKEALDWLKVRSPLAASVVQRIGFGELCRCKTENLETLRGQMRGFFKAEKDRAKTHGQVIESATQLENGLPMPSDQKLIGLAEKVGAKLQALPGGKNAA